MTYLALIPLLLLRGALILTGSSAAAAEQAPAAHEVWDFPQLMARMTEVQATKERFTESKTLAVLKEPLLLSGRLSYRRPDHLEKHILSPYEEHLVVEGDTLTLTNKEGKKQIALHRYPLIRAFVESIRGTLAGDATVLKRYYEVSFSGDRRRWKLILKPQEPQLAEYVRSIEVSGTDAQVLRVDIQEAGGDSSMMMIHPEAS